MERRQPTQCELFIRKASIFTPEGREGYYEAIDISRRIISRNPNSVNGENITSHDWNMIVEHQFSASYSSRETKRVMRRTMRYIDGKMPRIFELENTLNEMRPRGEVDIFAGRKISLGDMLGLRRK